MFFGLSSLLDTLVVGGPEQTLDTAPESPPGLDATSYGVEQPQQQQQCSCSKSVGQLRALHIEGLPLTMTASKLSEIMSAYGPVQYTEAAPDLAKDETGSITGRKLHCYVVFADHMSACIAKRTLCPLPPETAMPAAASGPRPDTSLSSAPSSIDGSTLAATLGTDGRQGCCSPQSSLAGGNLTPRWSSLGCDAPVLTPQASSVGREALTPHGDGGPAEASTDEAQGPAAGAPDAAATATVGAAGDREGASAQEQILSAEQEQQQQLHSPAASASAAAAPAVLQAPQLRTHPTLRVRFVKPNNVAAACTPAFRTFIAAQWAQATAIAKACPDYSAKKAGCKVNALFIAKLHQHITSARLQSLFGKFGRMIACEVQYHSDGRSAGHGVAIYETIEDAERALHALNGYRLEGRLLEVTPLRLKKLPSKLEHLKNRIKRLPPGPGSDQSGSEDGSSILAGGTGAANVAMAGSVGSGGLGALGMSRPLSASPRVRGAGAVLSPSAAAALSAHMAAAAVAAAASGGGAPPASPISTMSALHTLGLSPAASLSSSLGAMSINQQHQHAMAAAAAAANMQQQQQQQAALQAALAAMQGMPPGSAASLLQSSANMRGGMGGAVAPNAFDTGIHAAMLQAQAHASLLQHQLVAQRAAAAAAGSSLTPQQWAALSSTLTIGAQGVGGPQGVLLPAVSTPAPPGMLPVQPGPVPNSLQLSFT